jgi:chromosomal replication initiator protein
VAILRKRVALDHIALANPTVLELIAERVTANVRALEGALIRVVAYHSLTGKPIDASLAQTVLDQINPIKRTGPPSIDDVKRCVASYYKLSADELVSPSKAARIVWPRQVAIHLARNLTDASMPTIGQAFGGRNHATVIHAIKRVSQRLATDQDAAQDVTELEQTIRGRHRDRLC